MMEEFIIKRSVFYRELEEKYEKLKKVLKKTIQKKDYARKRKSFYDSSSKNQTNFRHLHLLIIKTNSSRYKCIK
jgi:hypothetical protein